MPDFFVRARLRPASLFDPTLYYVPILSDGNYGIIAQHNAVQCRLRSVLPARQRATWGRASGTDDNAQADEVMNLGGALVLSEHLA